MAAQSSTTPTIESGGWTPPEPKYITTLRAPSIYDEILLLLKPRLPHTEDNIASVDIWEFYADLLEAYLPALLKHIQDWNASDASALTAGEKAVADLRHAIEAWRALLKDSAKFWGLGLIPAGYNEVLQAFARAHGEAFYEYADGFEQDWRNWQRGA
jgi:hypothetical protein